MFKPLFQFPITPSRLNHTVEYIKYLSLSTYFYYAAAFNDAFM